ncbi:MAG: ATP-binding protein, partial [Brevundimonas sp.]|uniref:sensor histidine kinase n=1 Tax=Brevundimonas sp. TaxID=1871086 RepID=UPI002736430D
AYEDRDHLAITVEDRGPGIPPAELSNIFDKFKRLERPSDRGAGLGLGLAIAKGFAEAMGGRIAAASPVCSGGGTRFVVSFPKSVSTPRDFL